MSDASARFNFPFILPSQAQKHVTHNESIAALDVLVHLTFEGIGAEAPPSSPVSGETWSIGPAPTGEWIGQAGRIASFDGAGWLFFDAVTGMIAWDAGSSFLRVFNGTGWDPLEGPTQNLAGIGIGTTSDAANALAVSSDATLLTHAGTSHQVKINKASATDTASLLFQSDWTGHAEMGLAGGTDFSIKVSEDGASWITALGFDGVTGLATGEAVQQSATDQTPGRLATVDHTYGPGTVVGLVAQSAGLPTGAVIETGSNADGAYVRYADGTQICWSDGLTLSATGAATLFDDWQFPMDFIAPPTVQFTLSLVSSDWSGLDRSEISAAGYSLPPTETYVRFSVFPAAGTGTVTATIGGNSGLAVGRWF